MKVRKQDIDPELRKRILPGRLMMHASPFLFRTLKTLSAKMAGKSIEGLDCGEVYIPSSTGGPDIRTRIYKPVEIDAPLPVLVYFHGGGFFMGAPEAFNGMIEKLMARRKCIVIAPDYRKSVDAPFPAPLDDCYDALLWAKENAEGLGGRSDQIFTGGHSAGGGLTAGISFRARDRGDVKIAFQMPIYPMIDNRMQTDSMKDNNAPWWNEKLNQLAWEFYLDGVEEPISYEAAPSRATDYSGLPPTFTFVGDLEPFRDETIAYVENLKAAGVPVEFQLFKGCYHGFDVIAADASVSQAAIELTLDAFDRAADTYFAAQVG